MRARSVIFVLGAVGVLVACSGGGPGTFDGFDFYQSQPGANDPAKPSNDPESTTNDPGSCYIQAGTYDVTLTKVSGGSQCVDVSTKDKNQTFVIKQGGSLSDLVKDAQKDDQCTVVLSGCTASFHCTASDTTTTTTTGRDGGTTTTTTTSNTGPAIDETVTVVGDGLSGTITVEGCTYSFTATLKSTDTSDQTTKPPTGGSDGGTIVIDAGR